MFSAHLTFETFKTLRQRFIFYVYKSLNIFENLIVSSIKCQGFEGNHVTDILKYQMMALFMI